MAKNNLTQRTQNYASYLLTSGVVVAMGILGYCGMMVIYPSVALAWTAFLFAGLVEGEVYKQNILQGIRQFKWVGKRGLDYLIIKALNRQLEKTPAADGLLKEYQDHLLYLKAFQHHKLSKQQREEKEKAEKKLRRMQKYFVACVLEQEKIQTADLDTINRIKAQLPTLKRKRWYLWISLPLSFISGLGFGLATAQGLNAALIGMGIASAGLVWPLAAIAAVGYFFMIYKTLSAMIADNKIKIWREKIANWFKKKEQEKHYVLRILSLVLAMVVILGVSVLATLATAGTWWFAVKEGVSLIPAIERSAAIIRSIVIPITFLTGLLFATDNSIRSLSKLLADIKTLPAKLHAAKEKIKTIFAKEKIATRFNPFLLLTQLVMQPVKAAIFIGHLIATGLTGDRAPGLNQSATVASAAFGAISDGLVDYGYVTHDEHHHAPFIDWGLKIILLPCYLLATTWEILFSKDLHFTWPQFKTVFKKQFDMHTHDEETIEVKESKPVLWTHQELKQRFDKHIRIVKEPTEAMALRSYQSLYLATLKRETENRSTESLASQTTFFSKPTKTWLEKIEREYNIGVSNI